MYRIRLLVRSDACRAFERRRVLVAGLGCWFAAAALGEEKFLEHDRPDAEDRVERREAHVLGRLVDDHREDHDLGGLRASILNGMCTWEIGGFSGP